MLYLNRQTKIDDPFILSYAIEQSPNKVGRSFYNLLCYINNQIKLEDPFTLSSDIYINNEIKLKDPFAMVFLHINAKYSWKKLLHCLARYRNRQMELEDPNTLSTDVCTCKTSKMNHLASISLDCF